MAMTRKALREALKNDYIKTIIEALAATGEDVGMVGSNEFNLPVVDAEGNEDFIVVKVSIPTGSRDGEAYDGYGARQDYTIKCADKEAKAKKAAEAKAKKIARDEKLRASKAAAKAAAQAAAGKNA